jgi:hypothetical protein
MCERICTLPINPVLHVARPHFDPAVGRKVADSLTMLLETSVAIIKDHAIYNIKNDLSKTI